MADIGTWAEYWNEGVTLVPGPDGFGFNDPALADNATTLLIGKVLHPQTGLV